jgi:hypothetical protein
MLTPEDWAQWSKLFRGNVDLFRKMAEQREPTEHAYPRAMNRPWASPPPDAFKEDIESSIVGLDAAQKPPISTRVTAKQKILSTAFLVTFFCRWS